MTTYIAVLRAINLGAHNRIAMADLRAMLEKIGFEEPRTIVLSGNARSQDAIDKAEAIARGVEGVVSVQNDVKVKKDD